MFVNLYDQKELYEKHECYCTPSQQHMCKNYPDCQQKGDIFDAAEQVAAEFLGYGSDA